MIERKMLFNYQQNMSQIANMGQIQAHDCRYFYVL